MADIPYYFDTPVPSYFRKNGWFENENAYKFITWAFGRCQNIPHKIVIKNVEIILEPYEFVAGRYTSPQECFLTEKQFRGIADRMQSEGLLKKTANSRAHLFTCYIWVTGRFCKQEVPLEGRPRAHRGPTEGHEVNNKLVSLEEQQQAAVVFSCLEKITDPSITEFHKQQISSQYTEQTVIDAVNVICDPQFKPQDSLLKSLRAACKGNWKSEKASFEDISKNHELASSLESMDHAYKFVAGNMYLEIIKGFKSECVSYVMSHKNFCLEVESKGKIILNKISKNEA